MPGQRLRHESMHGMDAATLDELRTLRARAYGPSADIDDDPEAVRRLRELETRGDQVAAAPVEPPPAGAPALQPVTTLEPASAPTRDGDRGESAEPETAPASDEPPRAGDRRAGSGASGRTWALWTLSVLAAATLGAGLTYAQLSVEPVSAASGAPQIDTLQPDPLVEIQGGWFGAGPSSKVFEYYGLTLFETSGAYNPVSGGTCFTVVPTDQLPEGEIDENGWSISGLVQSGCSVASFPATVQLPIDSSVPQELRDRFAPGSALQFVFDGDRIGVFLDSGGS